MKRSLIALFAILLLVLPVDAQTGSRTFTVKDLYAPGKFSSRGFGGARWLKDGKRFVTTEMDTTTKSMNLVVIDAATGDRSVFVDGRDLTTGAGEKPIRLGAYALSSDESKVLVAGPAPEKQYLSRLQPAGDLYVFDRSDRSFRRVTNSAVEQWNQKFSPDARTVAFVRANDLYRVDVATGREERLTTDGTEQVINGKFDWVYEEEFGISDGFQFSPDGARIAFWRLDQTRVPAFRMVDHASMRSDDVVMKYPKPGDPNAVVKVGILDLAKRTTVWVDLGPNDDIYVPRIFWQPDGKRLLVARVNRKQNQLEFLGADPATGASSLLFTETAPAWIEESYSLTPAGQGRWITDLERDGYSHLYLLDANLKVIRQITKGPWDVGRIAGVDVRREKIYFSAAIATPVESHLHVVGFDGKGQRQLTKAGASHSASLSPTCDYIVDTWSTLTETPTTALLGRDGTIVRMLAEGGLPLLKEYAMGEAGFFTFTTTDGVTLHGWMIKPVGFDPAKKYPVLFNVYGGPGSQTVRNGWGGTNYLWHQMLAQKGYIVVSVDGRGTGARGRAFKTITYRNLGKWEVNDQVEAAKYLGTLPYVDKTRIGIWGWSYGGYMAALTILKGADVFSTAVAVAPVTHWKFYDTIYTERFMRTPQDNPEGYAESAPITHAGLLKGKLLLVHGTTDDNVHWQNSVQLIDALQKEGKQFEQMFYVNKNHGIGGQSTRVHLFEMITEFLLKNL